MVLLLHVFSPKFLPVLYEIVQNRIWQSDCVSKILGKTDEDV
jgi:hypothetical protein